MERNHYPSLNTKIKYTHMKRAYRFDGLDQLNRLVSKFGRDHFSFIPDEPGYLDSYLDKSGYLYHNLGYSSWTSGEPDDDAVIVTFEDAVGDIVTMEEQIKLAKSYIGKTVDGQGSWTIKKVNVVLSREDADKFKIASGWVVEDIQKHGFSVVVSDNNFANPVMMVKIKPNTKTIKLNDNYNAEVTKDTIKVGCQTFPTSIIDELLEVRNSL